MTSGREASSAAEGSTCSVALRGRVTTAAHLPRSEARPCRQATLTVCVPLDFAAFCGRQAEFYRAYARARIGTQWSRSVVEFALGDLTVQWPAALSSASPTQMAWRLVTERVAAAALDLDAADAVHRALPGCQADAVILLHQLEMTPIQAEDLTGVHRHVIAGHLALAHSSLPAHLADELGVTCASRDIGAADSSAGSGSGASS